MLTNENRSIGFVLRSLLAAACIFALSGTAHAGDLVKSARITRITIPAGPGAASNFYFVLDLDAGLCPTVHFSKAGLGNDDKAAERMYTMALAAYQAGKKVRIYNYNDANCTTPHYIRIAD